jgi:hypothetical protein
MYQEIVIAKGKWTPKKKHQSEVGAFCLADKRDTLEQVYWIAQEESAWIRHDEQY